MASRVIGGFWEGGGVIGLKGFRTCLSLGLGAYECTKSDRKQILLEEPCS